MGMLPISAQILDPFQRVPSYRNWGNGMDINPEDETSFTTQYQEAFLNYVANEYYAKHRHVPVNIPESERSSVLVTSGIASESGQSSFDPNDLTINSKGYLTPNNVAETTLRRSNRAACLLTAAWLHLHSPPEPPKHCMQSIQISMITTPTQKRWGVHFEYRT